MNAARHMHTATLLPNGAVLVAGGRFQDGGPGQASAELYDPATATFSPTGGMATPRYLHTATLLPNGKVLIAGGSDSVTAELYDPSTGTFAATGDMTEPGYVDTATLLPNGKVLITRSAQDYREDHADLYDPATGTFTRTGDLVDSSTAGQHPPATPGQRPAAMLLASGKVLIAGASRGTPGARQLPVDLRSCDWRLQRYRPTEGAGDRRLRGSSAPSGWNVAHRRTRRRGRLWPHYLASRICSVTTTCPGVAELYDPAAGAFGSGRD